jgi:hypothetical protein
MDHALAVSNASCIVTFETPSELISRTTKRVVEIRMINLRRKNAAMDVATAKWRRFMAWRILAT